MIIIADEATASNDDSVTAVSFLICRIRLWHAPSQDGGNLFICAEERGKGGQLASTIRQPSDKQYITAWDSQTNERGRRNVHSGWTEFCNHPATLITCIVLTYAFLIDARSEVWLHAYAASLNIAFVVIRGQDYSKERLSCQTLSYRTMCINATSCMQLPVLYTLLHKLEKVFIGFVIQGWSVKSGGYVIRCADDHTVLKITKASTSMIFAKSSMGERISFYQKRQSQSEHFFLPLPGFIWLAVRYKAPLSILIWST